MAYQRVTDQELSILRGIVGPERISTGESILDLHGKDESFHAKRKPEVVVWPLRAEEISQILRMANERRIPVTPWGALMVPRGRSMPPGSTSFRV